LRTASGHVHQQKPIVYQDVDGARHPISGRYVALGGSRVGFDIGSYDPRHELVIDPVVTYSTFLGGASGDFAAAIAVDATGAAYVTGLTFSNDFPQTSGTSGGFFDVFVAKLNPAGTALAY